MSNELTKQEEYLPALEDAGVGVDFGADDLTIPFIKLVQAMSGELVPASRAYNPDARPGLFINSATSELYGDKFDAVICAYNRRFNEWKPKAQNGGLAGFHKVLPADAQPVSQQNGGTKLVRPNGNILEDTAYYYLLLGPATGNPEDIVSRGLFSFHGTGMGTAKKLNMTIDAQKFRSGTRTLTKAIFSQAYRFSTNMVTTNLGSWYAVMVNRAYELDPKSDLYLAAKEFNTVALGAKVRGEGETDDSVSTAKTTMEE
jgi:hypothetical protein